jgi:hypothetical protein
MTPSYLDPFEGSWCRFDRAATHRKAATTEWNAFLGNDPYDFTLNVDSEGNATLYVEQMIRVPPIVGVLMGEYFQNLRTALDYVVYDVAVHDSRQDPPPNEGRLQFPIYATAAEWKRNQNRLAPLSETHRAWLKDIQPCFRSDQRPQWDALYWLNELARLDRHRQLHVVGGYITESSPVVYAPKATGIFFEDVDPYVFFEGYAEIARFTVAPYEVGDVVEANPQTAIDIEIRELARLRPDNVTWLEWPIRFRFLIIEALVDAIIGRFEKDCTGSTRSKFLKENIDSELPA